MKLLQRSSWTAVPPNPTTVGENTIGLPFFTKVPNKLTFHRLDDDVLYVYRNPANELHRLLKKTTNQTGVSDIDYNYAIAQNVEGVFVLRGALTKCTNTEDLKVLLMLGKGEEPTDLMLANQKSLQFEKSGLPPIGSNQTPGPVLKFKDRNVHVFNLIEFLSERGYYRARNDGIYGELTVHAVKLLQLDLDVADLNGVYDEWTHKAITAPTREYINNTGA